MKERFTNVAQKTLDVFVKFASTKAITALKDGFVLSMPITLVGSIFLLIANLPITGYTDFMARIFGSDWNLGLNQINNSTFNVLAMVIAVGIGYSYARNEKMDGISCGILTLVSFLIVSPSTLTVTSDTIKALGGDTATISNVLPNTWMGGNGIISAIIMGLIGSWVYTTCIKKNLRIKMPDAVPEGVSNAFSAMIPGFFIMCYSAIIYQVCQVFGGVSLTELIFKIIQTPMQGLTDNWAGAIIIVLLMSLLFWCGLHGPNIVSGIIYPVLTANSLVNQNLMDQGIKATQANGGHYLVPQLIDCFCKFGGVGLTLGFIVAALLVAKSAQVRELSKLSLVPRHLQRERAHDLRPADRLQPRSCSSPFICAPLVAVILTYGAMVIGFLPAFGAMQVPWTTPPIISGFLLGGWQGVVIQVLIFAASIAIWFPFVKMQDKICLKQEQTPRPSNRQVAGRPLRPRPIHTTQLQSNPLNKSTSQQRGRKAAPHEKETLMHIVLCCNQGMSNLHARQEDARSRRQERCRRADRRLPDLRDRGEGARRGRHPARTAGALELNRVKGLFPNIPVESINPQDYGLVRGENVLNHAIELAGK